MQAVEPHMRSSQAGSNQESSSWGFRLRAGATIVTATAFLRETFRHAGAGPYSWLFSLDPGFR
jgi:hypothetical protein